MLPISFKVLKIVYYFRFLDICVNDNRTYNSNSYLLKTINIYIGSLKVQIIINKI